VWDLAARQHGVVTRAQLLALGFTESQITRRIANGRLHPLWRGVYAVGRPEVSPEGRWLAAVLACGPSALLSHGSAATLWGLGDYERGSIEVSVPHESVRKREGIRVYRRATLDGSFWAMHKRIPLTSAVRTVIDLAPRLGTGPLETAINEAANLDLFSPDELRGAVGDAAGQPGVPRLRRILDRATFRLTRSELERRFLPLARRAGLPVPQTRVWVNGFEVDFFWTALGLVVETDSLRFHRTPAQQARDRLRDQRHTAAGLTPLRFTHAQIRYEPKYVCDTLTRVAARLTAAA
jgi:very-short-patch-repair endonuclease